MIVRAALICLSLIVAGCGSVKRPEALIPVRETVAGAKRVNIMVATTRGYDAATGNFTDKRSHHLTYQNLAISIPPNHKEGEIEWPPSYPANPAQHFVTLENQVVGSTDFLRAVEAALGPTGEVAVFVHGYNNNHEDAIFRAAQIRADSGLPNATVAFTWPSRGDFQDYVTDRESSLAARNRFEDLLVMLSKSPKIRKINVLGHSMGGMLVTETLVQAKLRGNGEFGGKLAVVVLASPDIDIDVFITEFEVIGKRPRPTLILTSRDDKALKVSSFIAGDVVRVGAAATDSPEAMKAIERYGFTVIDMTELRTGDRINHTKFAASPQFMRSIGAAFQGGLSKRGNPIGTFIADTAGAILEAPANALRRVTQ